MKRIGIFTFFSLLLVTTSTQSYAQCPSEVVVTKVPCPDHSGKQRFRVDYLNASTHYVSVKAWCGNCIERCISLHPDDALHTEYSDCFAPCSDAVEYIAYPTAHCSESPCTTLPLDFLSFDVSKEQQTVTLSWTVSMHDLAPSSRFEVQRSYDGRSFATIAAVLPDQSIGSYAYRDEPDAARKSAFYRILFIERERGMYSPLRMVSFEPAKKDIHVFQSGERIFFLGLTEAEAVTATLMDMTGTVLVQVRSATLATHGMEVGRLSKGIYIVSVYTQGGERYVIKFLN